MLEWLKDFIFRKKYAVTEFPKTGLISSESYDEANKILTRNKYKCAKCGEPGPFGKCCPVCGNSSIECFTEKEPFKKVLGDVFEYHYLTMTSNLKIYCNYVAEDAEFELLPAMYVIVDYAAYWRRKDRGAAVNAIIPVIRDLYPEIDVDMFNRRCALYQKNLHGMPLRLDWFQGDPEIFNKDAVTRCLGMLADILYNPNCADDYESAPFALKGIFEALMFFTQFAKPMYGEFEDFHIALKSVFSH